ncbi:MAG: hypothetical protein K5669_09595 [Lachnospiraceae bacterium]|nr:hypothetical protein [Lachnospiraceae bacterium]
MRFNFPILLSVIMFILVLQFAIRKARRKNDNADKKFWARENEANNVRRKSLDDVEYINVDFSKLPVDALPGDEKVALFIKDLEDISEGKIINLSGLTNTDLKLKYGVANLPFLSECDNRFTVLVQTLQRWNDYLWEKGMTEDAVKIMEYEVSIGSDAPSLYRRLASYYKKHGQTQRINELIADVENMNLLTTKSLLTDLKGYLEE